MRVNMKVAGCVLVFLSFTCFADDKVKWGYEGDVGPSNWGNLNQEFVVCKTGHMQAPIDIPTSSAARTAVSIQPHYKPAHAEVVNNGHTIQVNPGNAEGVNLNGVEHRIVQFHFHTPGEETVDGMRYPFNAHLVHQSSNGHLAVIGIFFKEGKENESLQSIFSFMPEHEGKVTLKANYDVSRLLPDALSYYQYEGSLTTPGCTEGVTFYILKTPVEISTDQLEQFKKIFPMNARPVMPLHGRMVTQHD